jgi:hypothetical protein
MVLGAATAVAAMVVVGGLLMVGGYRCSGLAASFGVCTPGTPPT